MPANTLSAEAQKLVDTLSELTESNRRTLENLRAYRGDSIQQIHDMVAGKIPCAPIRPTCMHDPAGYLDKCDICGDGRVAFVVKETRCIACEGVPSRKCPDCPDSLCADCWPDHNHGRL